MKAQQKKTKMHESPALYEKAKKLRISKPLVLKGIGMPKNYILSVKELNELRIDESYQRLRVTPWVNTLKAALLEGGELPAPLTLNRRPDGSLWIVDGQQRMWACIEANKPAPCRIYNLGEDYQELERKMYVVLNNHKAQSPNSIVKAWSGPIQEYLMKADSTLGHPLFERVNWGNAHHHRFAASVLVKSIARLLRGNGDFTGGTIYKWCGVADELMSARGATARCDAFFQVLLGVFPTAGVRSHLVHAFASVASTRIGADTVVPTSTIKRLARFQWSKMYPTAEHRFRLAILDDVAKRWDAK